MTRRDFLARRFLARRFLARRFLARRFLVATAMAALSVAAAPLYSAFGQAPPPRDVARDEIKAGSTLVELPSNIFVIDPATLRQERADNGAVDKAQSQLKEGGSFPVPAPPRKVEAALREVLLAALKRNLTIRRSGISQDIASRALAEAQAVFDPTFVVAASTTQVSNFTRIEHATRWKPQTEFVPVNAFDKNNNFYCSTTAAALTLVLDPADAAVSPDGGCYIIPLTATRSPVTTIQYDRKRAAGDYPDSRVEASVPDKFSPKRQRTSFGAVTLTQRLPWGLQSSSQVKLTNKQTYYKLNEVSSLPASWGEYGRPWVSSITTSLSIPLPGTRNFGPLADPEVGVAQRRIGIEAADYDVRATINSTLQSVETLFWTQVGAILNLGVACEAVEMVRGTSEAIRKLYEDGYVTTSGWGQLEAQLSTFEALRDQQYGLVLTTSERLREQLDDGEERLLLPIGWRRLLDAPATEPPESRDRVLDHPSYRRAAISIRLAELSLRQKLAQTRPNVTLTVTNKLDQSNAVFGYKTPGESLRESLNADIVTNTVTLAGQYQWGNRAARGAVAEADSTVRQQRLVLERVGQQLEEDYDTARINLASARQRLQLARNSAKLADAAYRTAFNLMNAGMQASYETLSRLQQRVSAQIAVNGALIDVRLAELRLYSAVGVLAERAGQRTAQTTGDRERLKVLAESRQFRHFYGMMTE